MTEVRARPNEDIESLIRRFSKKVEKSGILKEVSFRSSYEKPSSAKKRRHARSIKRERERQALLDHPQTALPALPKRQRQERAELPWDLI